MSDQDSQNPAPEGVDVPLAAAPEVAAPPAAAVPAPPSAPYVSPNPAPLPAPPVPDAEAAQAWNKSERVSRPLVGVSLWCFGALFWSYLVVGEIVVWTAVPEVLGVLAVLAAFGLAWHRGTSQMPRAPLRRRLLPGAIGLLLWFVAVVMSSAMFSTGGRSKAEMAAMLLWFFAAIFYAFGRHLTALGRVQLSSGARAARIALWLITAIATLMAGANIVSYA